jgi:cytochrome c553
MIYFTRFAPKFLVLFAALIFLLSYVGQAFSGPSVRHGLRQYRQHDMHHGSGHMGKGTCPQIRYTTSAPNEFLKLKNPLKTNSLNLFAGESLFHTDAQPTACKICHGSTGNGMGMKNISDGQMFWVVKNGSPGTGMNAYKNLTDEQVWQIILYLRTLAN